MAGVLPGVSRGITSRVSKSIPGAASLGLRPGPAPVSIPSKLTLRVILINGETLTELKVLPDLIVGEVKQELAEIAEVPACCLKLVEGVRELEDDQTVGQQGLQGGMFLTLVKIRPVPLSVYSLAHDDAELAQYMIACGAEPDEVGEDYPTTLLFAAEQKFPEVCHYLVDIDEFTLMNEVDDAGNTALHWAAYWELEDVCLAILERKDFTAISAVDLCGQSAFHYACSHGLEGLAWAFLSRDDFTSVAAIEEHGATSLHMAIMSNMPAVAMAILAHEEFTAEALNQCDANGQTAFVVAIRARLEPICEAILANANFVTVAKPDKRGTTALHHAARLCLPKTCQSIIRRFGQELVEVKDAHGQTAIDLAMESAGQASTADMMLEALGRRPRGNPRARLPGISM